MNFNSSVNKDLAYAIGDATLVLTGTVCKRTQTSGIVRLTAEVVDNYDFHWHKQGDKPNEPKDVLWGNNAAFVSQYLFLITRYHWSSMFKATRWID